MPDRWPVDFDDNWDGERVGPPYVSAVLGGISPNAPYNACRDLNNDGEIKGSDLLTMAPFLGKHCA